MRFFVAEAPQNDSVEKDERNFSPASREQAGNVARCPRVGMLAPLVFCLQNLPPAGFAPAKVLTQGSL